MPWLQVYNPFRAIWLSGLFAALPVMVLLVALGLLHIRAHWAAALGLASALLVALAIYGMPVGMAGMAAIDGALYGLLPIGWTLINVCFLYRLIAAKGGFLALGGRHGVIAGDRRLQVLLVAFCFGAFLHGAAGPVAAVAIAAAILFGLGFPPLVAAGITLVANTVPAAFGALAAPIQVLHDVTGLDAAQLSVQTGQLLPVFSVLVPFWIMMLLAGFRRTLEVWPAVAVTGLTFALAQYATAVYLRPDAVNVIAALFSMVCLLGFLQIWRPPQRMGLIAGNGEGDAALVVIADENDTPGTPRYGGGWAPWGGLAVVLWAWGQAPVQQALNALWAPTLTVPGLDRLIVSTSPAVLNETAETAVYRFNFLSMTGTAILVSALVIAHALGYRPCQLLHQFGTVLKQGRYLLVALAAMTAMAFVVRYSGAGITLGLVFAGAGRLYPFFAALLGWTGVVLAGSVASSNALFGSLPGMTAQALEMRPEAMAAALGIGGGMGGPVAAQSVTVAAAATQQYDQAGRLLRYVFLHSIALAVLVGIEALFWV